MKTQPPHCDNVSLILLAISITFFIWRRKVTPGHVAIIRKLRFGIHGTPNNIRPTHAAIGMKAYDFKMVFALICTFAV
jgi:hypothetical protein